MTEDAAGADIDNRNIASDDAHVEQQIAVQYGDNVRHQTNIYAVSEEDGPERKHEVALAYLVGGLPRRAEELFGTLVFDRHRTTERIYYYVLSVLSERGVGDITADLAGGIRDAGKLCASLPADIWTQAHNVVRNLLDDVQSNNNDGSFTAVAAFGGLPADRQDEISRHLSLLVGGVTERLLDAERKHQVGAERFSGNRVDRAWKFFEPEPAPPTRYQPPIFPPELDEHKPAVMGGVLATLAFAGLFLGLLTLPFWGGLSLLVAGCFVMVRYGIEHDAHLLHVSRRRYCGPEDQEPTETTVGKLVDRCFREARPEYAPDWQHYAEAYRTRLKRRFNAQFGPDPAPARKVKWLADWHARRVARQWPHTDPHFQPEPTAPGDAPWWRAVGVLLAMAGLVLLLFAAQRWQVVPLAVGGWFALPAVVKVFATRRAVQFQASEADALLEEETAEYVRWQGELVDCPDDGEMARWLALDKAYLKAEALRRGNIDENDLVSHVVINQRAPGGRRGVVDGGPPRYTAYFVTVILLTQYGARSSRVYLNFMTGEVKNENWAAFGYDRIASASLKMVEKTVKNGLDRAEHTVRTREFRLRLLDGAEIIKINERLDVESDTEVDDEAELDRLAAATSGMDAALPVLEAVAHQGRDWIALETDRRKAWSRVWSD
jgi:hypothetical protein